MRNFFVCSVGKPGDDYVEENLQRCLQNNAHCMYQGTPQPGVYDAVEANDIIFLKYNDKLVAYGEVILKDSTANEKLGEWNRTICVNKWVSFDSDNPEMGVSNYGIQSFSMPGSPYGTVKGVYPEYGLKRMSEIDASTQLYLSIVNEFNMQALNDILQNLSEILIANKNLVLTGSPGTGKTYLANALAMLIAGTESRIELVQFHPSYDYSDFVEGLRPADFSGSSIKLEVRDGTFKAFCKRANDDKSNNYVFIIDEINRADLSKVFGELFFGLEDDYRGKIIKTQYAYWNPSEAGMIIPKNIYLIGTMNDIDRSVGSIDFALRRRFAWKEISAESSMIIIDSAQTLSPDMKREAKKRMENLNKKIVEVFSSRAYEIGAAYFKKLEKYQDQATAFDKLWGNHLEVLLTEYLRGITDASNKLAELKKAYCL